MLATRLIAVILIHQGNVVQTRNFKIRNIVGSAKVAVDFFSRWSVDELILLDISPERNPHFHAVLRRAAEECFIPITAGGHIQSVEDAKELLRCGADKISINTAAHTNRLLIRELALHLGSQCVVLSIDASKYNTCVTERGTEDTQTPVIEFIQAAQELGAGEILLNSISHDGTSNGYDLKLLHMVAEYCRVPTIIMGGATKGIHFIEGIKAGADAVACANYFHHTEQATLKAKRQLEASGIHIRPIEHP